MSVSVSVLIANSGLLTVTAIIQNIQQASRGNMNIYIMRGLPGGGKTFFVHRLARELVKDGESVGICSADFYHCGVPKQPVLPGDYDKLGPYVFKPENLAYAHPACMSGFLAAYQQKMQNIFVDNTNIHAWEISPYVLLGETFGYTVEILEVQATYSSCLERQTHGVPELTMYRMRESLAAEILPPWWTVKRV